MLTATEFFALVDDREAKAAATAVKRERRKLASSPVKLGVGRAPVRLADVLAGEGPAAIARMAGRAVEELTIADVFAGDYAMTVGAAPVVLFVVDDEGRVIAQEDERGEFFAALRDLAANPREFGLRDIWYVEGTLNGDPIRGVFTGTLGALRAAWPDVKARTDMARAGVLGVEIYQVVDGALVSAGFMIPGEAGRVDRVLA